MGQTQVHARNTPNVNLLFILSYMPRTEFARIACRPPTKYDLPDVIYATVKPHEATIVQLLGIEDVGLERFINREIVRNGHIWKDGVKMKGLPVMMAYPDWLLKTFMEFAADLATLNQDDYDRRIAAVRRTCISP